MKITRGGRLAGDLTGDVARFTSSAEHDHYIADAVVEINMAHVLALTSSKYIGKVDAAALLSALNSLYGKVKHVPPDMEDIHMVVEEEVTRLVGQETGGKMHTGKSRNDQVATAIRMRLRAFIIEICGGIILLQRSLLQRAAAPEGRTVVPGYTHLQHAQPVTIAHWLLAHHDSIKRSFERILGSYPRVNLCPMGAAALAGTGFNIDRSKVAGYLGFDGLLENTMDAVASRDFALEVASSLAILMVDLSRFAEEMIVWSSSEFGYIEVPDDHASTSSIMPQKKNPVTLEIVRAKCGSVLGDLVSLMAIMKALPLAYNLDMQELTPHLWDACESTAVSLKVLADFVGKVKFNEARIRASLDRGSSVATELADVLVREGGMPFRRAHHVVGSLVRRLSAEGLSLSEVDPERLREMIAAESGVELTKGSVERAVSPAMNVDVRSVRGGPSYAEAQRMIGERMRSLGDEESAVASIRCRIDRARDEMMGEVAVIVRSGASS
ncbi:MAG: argininosuccinate lyase [Candidatus Methanosuratincola sp.]|nr:argininosuccinate lyase [Candidatus Methanosuratincola sp.]